AVELAGLFLRLDVELSPEQVHTGLVLPKSSGSPAQVQVKAQGCAVGGSLEGVERKKPEGRGQRPLRGPRYSLDLDELGERLECQFPHAFPLCREPFLEGGWMRPLGGEALEEVASIQDGRPFQRVRRP